MKKKRNTSPSQTLRYVSAIGLTMVVAVVSLLGSFKQFEELLKHDTLHFGESVGLVILSIGLFLQYWWNSSYELDMLTEHLGELNTPRIKIQTYIVIICLGIFFGILISFSHKILIYCVFIIVYSLFDLWGSWQVLKSIAPLIKKRLGVEKLDQERRIIETIHEYYFSNPTLQRIVTIMFFSWIAFAFALLAIYEKSSSRILQFVAYLTIGLNIVVSELIITIWRRRRNRVIEALEDQK